MKFINKILCFLGLHDDETISSIKIDNFGSYELKSICRHCGRTTIEIVRYAPTGDVTSFKFTRWNKYNDTNDNIRIQIIFIKTQ